MSTYTVVAAPPRQTKIPFNYALEALRGVAALLVVLSHGLTDGPKPDSTYVLTGFEQYQAPGHLGVIVFFFLSGYVIGLSNPTPITTAAARKQYLHKRFVRLYPLYLVALLITVLVAAWYHEYYSLGTLGAYLLFLQGLAVRAPFYNPPIWSLSYEVLYYLLFLLISARRWRPEWVASGCLLLALLASHLPLRFVVLASYAYGAVYWLLGLCLVRLRTAAQPMHYGTALALLLLLLSYSRLDLLHSVLQALRLDIVEAQVPSFFDRAIVFSDLSYLVFCVPLLLVLTGRTVRGQHWLEWAAFAMPSLYLLAYIISGKIRQPALFHTLFSSACLYFLALGTYLWRDAAARYGETIFQKLAPLGLISYGLYVTHYPFFFLFHRLPVFRGTAPFFLARLVLYFALVLAIAWVLERRLQPWFKRKLT